MMMQPYKQYFIEGSALMVHPFSPDWFVDGSVLSGRFEFNRFLILKPLESVRPGALNCGHEDSR
jgi:hypothetical protein